MKIYCPESSILYVYVYPFMYVYRYIILSKLEFKVEKSFQITIIITLHSLLKRLCYSHIFILKWTNMIHKDKYTRYHMCVYIHTKSQPTQKMLKCLIKHLENEKWFFGIFSFCSVIWLLPVLCDLHTHTRDMGKEHFRMK